MFDLYLLNSEVFSLDIISFPSCWPQQRYIQYPVLLSFLNQSNYLRNHAKNIHEYSLQFPNSFSLDILYILLIKICNQIFKVQSFLKFCFNWIYSSNKTFFVWNESTQERRGGEVWKEKQNNLSYVYRLTDIDLVISYKLELLATFN